MTHHSLRAAVDRFLAASKQPAVLEPGDAPLPLIADHYHLESRGSRLLIEAWDEGRNLHRRITGVAREKAGRLTLEVERFGRGAGTLELIDLARPSVQQAILRSAREHGADILRRMLSRQYPDWRCSGTTSGADLENTLSPAYARGSLTKGTAAIAALLAPRGASGLDALTFGLLWLDYLRRRERKRAVESLALFVAAEQAASVQHVLGGLEPERARISLFGYDQNGVEEQWDARDAGNLASSLLPAPSPDGKPMPMEVRTLSAHAEVQSFAGEDGVWSFRVRGLEFARWRAGRLELTMEATRQASLEEAEEWASALATVRHADGDDHGHPWFRRNPEAWLEAQVRAHLDRIDGTLLAAPLYGQVLARAGGERGVVDMLAIDRSGRVALLELKAQEDPHLPIQALDYWVRLRRHVAAGELAKARYFPGMRVRTETPRLLLVAPAMQFHSTTERLLAFFRPEVEVERVGVGVEWRESLRVVMRLRGADRPEWDAEGSLEEHACPFPDECKEGAGFTEPIRGPSIVRAAAEDPDPRPHRIDKCGS